MSELLMIRKCVSWKTRCSLITLSETIQMEILPQTVESNLSLYLFIRERHQTPSLSCTATNTELTHTHATYSLFLLALRHNIIFFYHSDDAHPHLKIWNGELAAGGGQVGFGNGALEFLYTG